MAINPLIGRSPTDTLENLCLCLDKLGPTLAHQHDDAAIGFFCSSVAAALRFEVKQLHGSEARTAAPMRLAASS